MRKCCVLAPAEVVDVEMLAYMICEWVSMEHKYTRSSDFNVMSSPIYNIKII